MALGLFNLPPGATIVYKTSYLEFPTIGNSDNLYFDTNKMVAYRWDNTELKYFKVSQDWEDIEVINGGNANG